MRPLQHRLKHWVRMGDRLLELSPNLVRHPAHVVHAIRGVHPALLAALDQTWLKEIGFRTILDVGANTGQFSGAAHTVFPDAHIYAFEPLPDCFDALNARMRDNQRFQAFPYAIGESDGSIVIHRSAASPSSSILPMTERHTDAFPWTAQSTDVEVGLRRLDSLLPQLQLDPPILLKVDVQGYGLHVLRGAAGLLARVDLVLVETSFVPLYEGEATFDQLYAHMTQAGFAFRGFLDQLLHPSTGQPLQGDAIFIHPHAASVQAAGAG